MLMGEPSRFLGGRRGQDQGDRTGPQAFGSRVTEVSSGRGQVQRTGVAEVGAELLEHLSFLCGTWRELTG